MFVASVVRVITFNQLKLKDETYTNIEPAIWTVVEQSLGITCACLPTLRPLFGRLLFGTHTTTSSNKFGRDGDINLTKMSYKPSTLGRGDEESTTGFARLPEANMPASTVTTQATAGFRGEPSVVPDAILKSQSIEQHYDSRDRI